MLKVIGAGYPRTGTLSTKVALERLGFGPCHHMFEVMSRPEQTALWSLTPGEGEAAWDRLYEGYVSAVDWPTGYYWEEVHRANPDAKILLTVRDPRRRYKSAYETIFQASPTIIATGEAGEEAPEGPAPGSEGAQALERIGKLRKTLLNTMWRGAFGVDADVVPDEATAIAAYERHIEHVRATVPADDLLVFEVSQGWEPLCDFLGVPVPEGEPFPRLNEAQEVKKHFADVLKGEAPSY
ncbi:sulfotransferase family protein [Nocardiopsis sp. RSe5-2]|uniref:Sulfotransferase family protein n=1 Tax=Nocardiopsis endophytica TaxID=3018445 RepID=A0ABT4TZQ8_9ACTN|nr:sulfotransferase family protein [Nocardiopsis endophytica]MDA2810175.1 sulfotransferase family protein [Nocardiopsis endophytica]